MSHPPDPRLAFGLEATALAQLALDRRFPRGSARGRRIERLVRLMWTLGPRDLDLAREAVAAFADRVAREPEEAGRALRDFVLDWTRPAVADG